MGKKPTCDSFTYPSPSVSVFITLNPTQVARSIPANENIKQQKTYHIQISTYITQIKLTRYEIHT